MTEVKHEFEHASVLSEEELNEADKNLMQAIANEDQKSESQKAGESPSVSAADLTDQEINEANDMYLQSLGLKKKRKWFGIFGRRN